MKALSRYVTYRSSLAFFALLFLIHLALVTVVIPDKDLASSVSTMAAPVETLLAIAGLWWAAHRSGARSRELKVAWGLLAASHISWFIGDILWAILELGLGISPFPSVADLFYFFYYPLFIAGVLLIPMRRLSVAEWLKLSLDMGIVTLASMLLFWYFWIGPITETSGSDILTMALSIAYPVADFLLVTALFFVVSRRSKEQPAGPIWILAAGIGLQVLTDAVFGYQSIAGTYEGGILDLGWIAAIFLAGLAGFRQADMVAKSAASDGERGSAGDTNGGTVSWVFYVPLLWLAAAYILLLISSGRRIPMTFPTLIIWVGIIILLAVARQVTSLRENVALFEEQRKADRALRQSEEKYRAVVENANEAIAVAQDGLFRYLNPSALAMTGYAPGEILGRPFSDIIHPEDIRILAGEYERKMRGDTVTYPTQYRILTRDGASKSVEGTGVLIEWMGRPAILVYVRDISEQKRAEEEKDQKNRQVIRYQTTLLDLAKSDLSDLPAAFSRIAEAAAQALPVERAGIWLFDDGRTSLLLEDLYTSSKGTHEAGHRFDSALYPRYFAALDESRLIAADDATADERTGEFAETYLVPLDIRAMIDAPIRLRGALVGALCLEHTGSPRRWSLEEQEFAASVADTISLAIEANERKIAETALQESEERYRTLFDSSLDTVFTVDLRGYFTSINRAGETLIGYPRDELLGTNFRRILSPEMADSVFSAYNALYKSGKPLSGFRYSFTRPDGQERTVEGYVTLQRKGGTVIGFQGTVRDITDRLRLEQQLIQSQKMEAVGTMAGGIAHNFNNIMVGIMGYSEYLMMNKKPDDPDYKAISVIHEGTVRASELTKQMLGISRGGRFNLAAVKLNRIIERILPLIDGMLDKSINVQAHLSPDLMNMEGDVSQIEQCLVNLCINARDAMPGGGTLIVETHNQVLDDDFLKSHLGAESGPHVVVTISDTGTGITPEIREHIFEPFFTTKREKGGTGMGLATVYGIVRSHRGIISVYSEVGEGTSFKLYFPVSTIEEEERPPHREMTHSVPGATILLIDDESVVREMWEDFLTQRGYRVITARDGVEGIARFREHKGSVDLVILDLIMPNLGGKETLARLREIDPDLKVLVSSGYSENGQAGRIVDLGIDGFVQKPARLTQLEKQIVEILEK